MSSFQRETIHARLVRAHALAVEHRTAPALPAPVKALRQDGAYRTAEPRREDLDPLIDVLESPLSNEANRLEAARRLIAATGAEQRERVLLVADACARAEHGAALRAITRAP